MSETSTQTRPADDVTTGQPAPRRRHLVVAALLVIIALGALAFAGYQWNRDSAAQSARDGALEAAKNYATDLSSYDFHHLDTNFAAVNANAHGQFAEQYKQVSASLTELIKQNQAVSQGSVLSAGIVQADQDRAVVLLFVDQKITNTNSPQPRIDRNRMQMTLVHVDDRWLIDGIQLM